MKLLLILLIATPVMAQTDYYDNRFNGRMTEVYSKQNYPTASANGYYYDANKNIYYKPKSINRDVYSISPQGSLSWTYNTEQYKPKNLRISR